VDLNALLSILIQETRTDAGLPSGLSPNLPATPRQVPSALTLERQVASALSNGPAANVNPAAVGDPQVVYHGSTPTS
jgi:hypothetical protein